MKKLLSMMMLLGMCLVFASVQATAYDLPGKPAKKVYSPVPEDDADFAQYENADGLKKTHVMANNSEVFAFVSLLIKNKDLYSVYKYQLDSMLRESRSACYAGSSKVYVIEKDGVLKSVIRTPRNICDDSMFSFRFIEGFDIVEMALN